MTGAADVHLDHDGRAAICGDVNAVGRVNNEGLVNGVVALEGLTGIRVGYVLVRPLLDCGVLGLQLDMHSGLAGGRVKRAALVHRQVDDLERPRKLQLQGCAELTEGVDGRVHVLNTHIARMQPYAATLCHELAVELQLPQPAAPEQEPRPRARELKHRRPATQ